MTTKTQETTAVTDLIVVPNSSNAKTGPGVACTYRPVGSTCPTKCAARGFCYAKRGRVRFVAKRSSGKSGNLLSAAGNVLIRHLVSGDWLRETADGRKIVDRRLLTATVHLHRNAPWLTGWGYTHAPEQLQRAGFGPGSWPDNLRILASCEDPAHAQELQRAGWQTARVIDNVEDKVSNETLCPYDSAKRDGVERRTNCNRCRKCFETTDNIAFLKV